MGLSAKARAEVVANTVRMLEREKARLLMRVHAAARASVSWSFFRDAESAQEAAALIRAEADRLYLPEPELCCKVMVVAEYSIKIVIGEESQVNAPSSGEQLCYPSYHYDVL
jgi:hypothetical protein